MSESRTAEQEEKLQEVGLLLLEVKCIAILGALASDSCVIDKELQLQDNIDYYFALRKIVNSLIPKALAILNTFSTVVFLSPLSIILIKLGDISRISSNSSWVNSLSSLRNFNLLPNFCKSFLLILQFSW